VRSATKRSEPARGLRELRRELVDDRSLRGSAFASAYTDAADGWLRKIVGDEPGVALIAVGAFGRRELCPASDLDLVLVHDGRRKTRQVAELADRVWYPVWDSGVALDHSVRTIKDALAVAGDDLKAALGLLEARLVVGDPDLAALLIRRVREAWIDRARHRLTPLREMVNERQRAAGDVAFALEPDLKAAKGGMRDLAILRVLATVTPVVTPDMVRLSAAGETLLEARIALQRRAGATDRLVLARQDEVAADLDDADADALMGRVSSAGRMIAWQSDDAWRSVGSWLQGPRGRSAVGADRALGPGLVLRDGEVALVADASPADDPSVVLRAASAAAHRGVPIARATLDRFEAELGEVASPWTTESRDAFLALLGAGDAAVLELEFLDQHGLLQRFLPEWDLVRSRVQRNAFHRYTVDRHLLETVARACDLVRRVRRPDLLLMGALLHDLGKGMPGDHTDNGVELAGDVARRMGFSADDVSVIVDLVRHHLLLPSYATGRDLDDPSTIAAVAAAVGSVQMLDLLHALTEADSIATGETAWTPWKAQLVSRLVDATREVLHDVATPERPESGWPAVARWDGFDGRARVEPVDDDVVIVAPDAVGLLATEVAVLGVHALDVRSARTKTIGTVAVGEFSVESQRGVPPDWEAVQADLRAALDDPEPVRGRLEARALRYAPHAPAVAAREAEPRVFVDNDATPCATVVEVRAADGIGVLFRITSAFASLGIRVEQAYVSTLGHEVVDTFYVTGADRSKIVDPETVALVAGGVLRSLTSSRISDDGAVQARRDVASLP
jgi:[protein-PII] uridylyltransferase